MYYTVGTAWLSNSKYLVMVAMANSSLDRLTPKSISLVRGLAANWRQTTFIRQNDSRNDRPGIRVIRQHHKYRLLIIAIVVVIKV